MITSYKKYMNEHLSDDNLVPDYIIDTFYNKIKKLLETYKKDDEIIKFWLRQLETVNGKIPSKIEKLLNDN